MKALGYPFCLRTLVRWCSFLPQVVLPSGDGSGSVEQAFDQSPLDLGWMVGVEVQVPVCVGGFPVDGDVQATIILPLEQGVKKGEPSVLLHLHSEPDGWSHAVQVGQELFHCALLHNAAGVVYIPLPEEGFVGAVLSASSSKNSMYRSATTAETGEPIAAPSRCSKKSPP